MQFYKYQAGRRLLSSLARAGKTPAFEGGDSFELPHGKARQDRRKTDRNDRDDLTVLASATL